MAEFSGKVVSAVYMDPEYSMIKVRFEDGDNLAVYNLMNNENDPDYKDLLAEGWDHEKIVDETAELKRAESAAFNFEVHEAAKVLLVEKYGFGEENESKDAESSFTWEDFFDRMNSDKDEIFKFKIWAFESEKMKSVSPEVKRELRKAPSLIEALNVFNSVS